MKIVDQFHDPAYGTMVNQLRSMPALQEFLKEASIDDGDSSSLPDTAFAWESQRRFPVHTPEHAALSYAYSKVAHLLPPFVLDNIKKAMEVYNIPETIFEQVKVASETEKVAYIIPSMQKYPVKTAADVEHAQRSLLDNFRKLDLEHRAEAFTELVKQGEEHKVKLHPGVYKLAGMVVCDFVKLSDQLEARAGQLADDKKAFRDAYLSLSNGVRGRAPSKDRTSLVKMAEVIGTLDEKSGLDRFYDRKIPDAIQTVFNTDKLASDSIDLGDGKMTSLAKLAQLPASFWGDLAGPHFMNEVAPGGNMDLSKLAEVIETLPLDLKIILRNQVR